jgi:hypothetical protein
MTDWRVGKGGMSLVFSFKLKEIFGMRMELIGPGYR